jgi:trehalose 6-phosphate phosphatase
MSLDVVAADLDRPRALDLSRTALFLDIDGTLAEFEAAPDLVGPLPRRTRLLRALVERLDGRVAAVSGRDIASIDRILDNTLVAAAGVHGLERRRADGALARTLPHPALNACLDEARAFAAGRPGVLVEDKGIAFAVHYRRAPTFAAEVEALARRLASHGLTVQPGDMVVELKTPGADKGGALRAFMAEPPFASACPVFVGDDLTDESAFAVAAALGGYGVLVGRPRVTAARHRLDDVQDVLGWLETSVGDRPL